VCTKAVDLAAPRRESKARESEARVRIRLYGRLADLIGRHIELEAPDGSSIAMLKLGIAADHPAAAETLSRSRGCIGGSLIGDEHIPAAADSLELMPPVSGG
jgi:molybdopterin converting factor small subunit